MVTKFDRAQQELHGYGFAYVPKISERKIIVERDIEFWTETGKWQSRTSDAHGVGLDTLLKHLTR